MLKKEKQKLTANEKKRRDTKKKNRAERAQRELEACFGNLNCYTPIHQGGAYIKGENHP